MVTAGGASWKEAAFPEAAHTDETKRNNLQTRRIHALSRNNMAWLPGTQQPLSSLESGRRSRRSVEQRHDATMNDRHHLANAFIAS